MKQTGVLVNISGHMLIYIFLLLKDNRYLFIQTIRFYNNIPHLNGTEIFVSRNLTVNLTKRHQSLDIVLSFSHEWIQKMHST